MASKAFGLAQLGNVYSDGALSSRNLIINGAMQVAQRGTSAAISSSGTYVVDRFAAADTLMDELSATLSQNSDAPDGFANSLKVTINTPETTLASTESLFVSQLIEAQNLQSLAYGTSSAKACTLSFWVKSSLTGVAAIWIYQPDSNRAYAVNYTINAADTWEYKTLTISGDTSGTINNDNGQGFNIRFYLSAGSAFTSGTADQWATFAEANRAPGQTLDVATSSAATWQITGVQLELGDTATPFEHRSYGQELALCQRYFYSNINIGGNRLQFDTYVTTGIYPAMNLTHPMTMRAAPTVTKIETWTGSNLDQSTLSFIANITSIKLQADANGTGRGYLYPNINGGFSCDAEL